jgi:hypothetical protein
MRASPFLKPLEAEALEWEALLLSTQVGGWLPLGAPLLPAADRPWCNE